MDQFIYKVNRIFYYEVNGKKFDNEIAAKEYALKLFLAEEVTKIWKSQTSYSNYSCYLDKDDKTIVVYIYSEPEYDNWNVGHYGCTSPKIFDNSKYYRFKTIADFYKDYSEEIKEIFKVDDSININYLKSFCTEETINNMLLYKDMVKQLKNTLKIPIEKEKAK